MSCYHVLVVLGHCPFNVDTKVTGNYQTRWRYDAAGTINMAFFGAVQSCAMRSMKHVRREQSVVDDAAAGSHERDDHLRYYDDNVPEIGCTLDTMKIYQQFELA